MNNLERAAYGIIPNVTKLVILAGIVVFFVSITIAICSYIKKKQTIKEIRSYLFYASGGGVIAVCGFLVNFIANFNIDFGGYKQSIPLGYIASLIGYYFLYNSISSRRNERIEKKNIETTSQ